MLGDVLAWHRQRDEFLCLAAGRHSNEKPGDAFFSRLVEQKGLILKTDEFVVLHLKELVRDVLSTASQFGDRVYIDDPYLRIADRVADSECALPISRPK